MLLFIPAVIARSLYRLYARCPLNFEAHKTLYVSLPFYRVCEKEMNLKRVAGAGIKSLSQTNWFLHLNISGNSCDSFKSVFLFFYKLKPSVRGVAVQC